MLIMLAGSGDVAVVYRCCAHCNPFTDHHVSRGEDRHTAPCALGCFHG